MAPFKKSFSCMCYISSLSFTASLQHTSFSSFYDVLTSPLQIPAKDSLVLGDITRVSFHFRAKTSTCSPISQLLWFVPFTPDPHTGYVSWRSFSPAARNWICSASWWTTVAIMSTLCSRIFCHCCSKDWAKGSTSSPTLSLLTPR